MNYTTVDQDNGETHTFNERGELVFVTKTGSGVSLVYSGPTLPGCSFVPQQHGGTLVIEDDGSQHVEYESGDSSVPTDSAGHVWTRQPTGA